MFFFSNVIWCYILNLNKTVKHEGVYRGQWSRKESPRACASEIRILKKSLFGPLITVVY